LRTALPLRARRVEIERAISQIERKFHGADLAGALAAAAAAEPTGGEFCWDALDGAAVYVLSYATPGPPGNAWRELARVDAATACPAGGGPCCALFQDAPGDLVYYTMRGEP